MNMQHRWKPLLVVLLAMLAACGGGQADTAAPTTAPDTAAPTTAPDTAASDIPLYPGAASPESGSELAAMVNQMKQQLAQGETADDESTVSVEGYVLPEGATFDQVMTFYEEELANQGWRIEPMSSAIPSTSGATATWSDSNGQAGVSVMVMGDPAGGERNILFIIRGEAPPASDTVPAATPDTAINDIPIYPGATPAESGSELAEMVDSMRRQSGGDVVEGYVLPEGITYEDAIAFYKAEMPELGWRFVPIRVNSDIGISTTWIRDAEEGGIAIMAMDDTSGRDRDFLFITGPVSP